MQGGRNTSILKRWTEKLESFKQWSHSHEEQWESSTPAKSGKYFQATEQDKSATLQNNDDDDATAN